MMVKPGLWGFADGSWADVQCTHEMESICQYSTYKGTSNIRSVLY